jgi:pyruvate formate lyase activating enzyme
MTKKFENKNLIDFIKKKPAFDQQQAGKGHKSKDNIHEVNQKFNRRNFIKYSAKTGISVACSSIIPKHMAFALPVKEDDKFIREASFYEKLDFKKIRCTLCPRECVIDERERGYCGVRENREGTYYTLVYARPCTYHADPIEKKPLFHFKPGSLAFSIATAGCNVNCKFCQNWEISQVRPEHIRSIHMPPKKVSELAIQSGCASIAYTYSEPTIFYEYMLDSAAEGKKADIKSVVITAGYISQEPLIKLCRQVDAIKVDLKAFSEKFYKEIVKGELKPVLNSLVTMRKMNIWTEIVYLVVPTLNDSEREFVNLCQWIRKELGQDVPIHFTRFHPQYLLKNLPPTPIKTLELAKQIADAEGLNYVYIGNVPGHPAENTYCPNCKEMVVRRMGYIIREINIDFNKCKKCGQQIAGLW